MKNYYNSQQFLGNKDSNHLPGGLHSLIFSQGHQMRIFFGQQVLFGGVLKKQFLQKATSMFSIVLRNFSCPPLHDIISTKWVFPKIGVPPKHPKMVIFSRKTHGCWVPPL